GLSRLPRRPSCGAQGDPVAETRAGTRWLVVGPLGCELYLWHLLRPFGPAGNRRQSRGAMGEARRAMAQVQAKPRRRMGRELPERPRTGLARPGSEHRVPNRVGVDGAPCW